MNLHALTAIVAQANWHSIVADWGPIIAPVCVLLGVVVAPELGRRAGRASAAAALTQAKAAEENAKAAQRAAEAATVAAYAEMKKGIAAEREAATKEWAQITEGMQRWNQGLELRIGENTARIEEAELRALADRERADRSERLYSKAIIYLRRLIRWIDQTVPDEQYPSIPAELQVDL